MISAHDKRSAVAEAVVVFAGDLESRREEVAETPSHGEDSSADVMAEDLLPFSCNAWNVGS